MHCRASISCGGSSARQQTLSSASPGALAARLRRSAGGFGAGAGRRTAAPAGTPATVSTPPPAEFGDSRAPSNASTMTTISASPCKAARGALVSATEAVGRRRRAAPSSAPHPTESIARAPAGYPAPRLRPQRLKTRAARGAPGKACGRALVLLQPGLPAQQAGRRHSRRAVARLPAGTVRRSAAMDRAAGRAAATRRRVALPMTASPGHQPRRRACRGRQAGTSPIGLSQSAADHRTSAGADCRARHPASARRADEQHAGRGATGQFPMEQQVLVQILLTGVAADPGGAARDARRPGGGDPLARWQPCKALRGGQARTVGFSRCWRWKTAADDIAINTLCWRSAPLVDGESRARPRGGVKIHRQVMLAPCPETPLHRVRQAGEERRLPRPRHHRPDPVSMASRRCGDVKKCGQWASHPVAGRGAGLCRHDISALSTWGVDWPRLQREIPACARPGV